LKQEESALPTAGAGILDVCKPSFPMLLINEKKKEERGEKTGTNCVNDSILAHW
jgi:hypothetical protein